MTAPVRPLPALVDFASLGGALSNYAPVEDPTTDLDAACDNTTRANVAAMSYTCARAFVSFTVGAGGSVIVHGASWGDSVSVAPTVTNPALGTYVVTWPATVTDLLGDTATLAFRAGMANVRAAGIVANCAVSAANAVTVHVWDLAIGAATGSPNTLDVWVS